ncbi:MAG: hypothetical protein IJF71_04785 [Clostridia bacterium]|nr:hypothetical protein [Clostridia bacterium]
MDGKFFVGLTLGMLAGVFLLDQSKDVKSLVAKGKEAVKEKIQEKAQEL